MNALLSNAALAVMIGWVAFALAGLTLTPPLAAALGAVLGLGAVLLFHGSLALGALIALLAPFGVLLPALALRHAAAALGLPIQPFSTTELLVFLILYTAFLAAATGAIPVDLYRWGYAPIPVALMVLALCCYGALTGSLFVPLVAVLGQAVWALGWGSSNWFDEVSHAMLVPILVIVLITRAL